MKGHALAARYDSPRIANESQLLAVYKYVMRNPVRAGLCTDPDDWQWSSYAATVGLAPPIDFVDASTIVACLDCPSREEGIERLKRFVGEA
jgi:hypothetical protein